MHAHRRLTPVGSAGKEAPKQQSKVKKKRKKGSKNQQANKTGGRSKNTKCSEIKIVGRKKIKIQLFVPLEKKKFEWKLGFLGVLSEIFRTRARGRI